jgi:ComF family protein
MLRTGTTGHFLARRIWNLVLDELFPENHPYCKLCRKPLPGDAMVSRVRVRTRDHTGGKTGNEAEGQKLEGTLESICPFCAQEAEQVKLVNLLKSVPLQHVNLLASSKMGSSGERRDQSKLGEPSGYAKHAKNPQASTHQAKTPQTRTVPRTLPIVCALEYSGFVRTSIRHFKYDGLTELVPWFTSAMKEVAEARHIFEHVDGIVHVPTSADRAKKRGYDQAYLLANSISKSTRLTHIPVLGRRKDESRFTQSQTAKSKADRIKSLQGKFVCSMPSRVQGKRVLLVDDVVTTGATMQTCANLLLESGAKSVIGLVVAYVR